MDGIFAPWHIILLLVVVLVLFGAKRLPFAAKSLGDAMHIFKRSVQGMSDQDQQSPGQGNGQGQPMLSQPQFSGQQFGSQGASDPARQAQLDDLQRQISDLRSSAGGAGTAASTASTPEPQPRQQSY